ncbi:hypothetical protein LINPERPRIM_LOCUS23032 [Linum perenne]
MKLGIAHCDKNGLTMLSLLSKDLASGGWRQ